MAAELAPFKVGLIGCGGIAPAYVRGCRQFAILELAGCADLDHNRAQGFGIEHGVTAYTVDELLGHPDIDILVNLTVPQVHAQVSQAIIAAGKHVYSEKPLALDRDEGQQVLDAAAAAGLRVGCAPDTFLGGGLQTCRAVIDSGRIGTPLAATAFLASRGPESWHQNPFFFYLRGGGPLFDMGPYYLTALTSLLGPVRRITASTRRSFKEREAGHETIRGAKIPVEINTHAAGILDFVEGPVATLTMSFDVWKHNLPIIEIYGSEGTLSVPDPNTFGGVVRVFDASTGEWAEVPHQHSTDIGRGVGVADLAHAIREERAHRASGHLAYHILDIMQAFDESSESDQHIDIHSRVDRPQPLPVEGLPLTSTAPNSAQ